jgi:anti-sigma factor RsiW
VSCEPEKVTAFVDEALAPRERAVLDEHIGACGGCRQQLEDERAVRVALRRLDGPEPPPGLEARLRARLEQRTPSPLVRVARVLLPLAAVLVLASVVSRTAPLVAWQLARDHGHCYSYATLPASVRSADPAVVSSWFEGRGTPMPALPDELGRLPLFGARYCRLVGRSAIPHLYYTDGSARLSLFVLPPGPPGSDDYRTVARGEAVALVRLRGSLLGVVGEDAGRVGSAVERLRAASASSAQPPVVLAAMTH